MRLKAAKKTLLNESVEYSVQNINYAKREQEKLLLFKLTLESRFTLSRAQSVSCHVCGLSTLNSNGTNHKPRKKLANQKRDICSCDSAGFEHDIALIFRRSIQKVLERLRRRQNQLVRKEYKGRHERLADF